MGLLLWASLTLVVFSTEAAIPNRRQVLPPIPGYIPVYIQHGDVPPEDSHEYAGIFQVADNIAPPRVSPTMNFPTTTTEMSSDRNTEIPATPIVAAESEKEVTSNAVPETTSGSNEGSKSDTPDPDIEGSTPDNLGNLKEQKIDVGNIDISKPDAFENVEELKSDDLEPNKQPESGSVEEKNQMRFIEWKIINPTP